MTKSMKCLGVRAALVLALVMTAACGEDTVLTPTFGDGCTRGTLTPGDTVTGAFDIGSCFENNNFWNESQTSYESWRVTLQAGKGYLFYMGHSPDSTQGWVDDVDPMLTLFGENNDGFSVPLAHSDDEADAYNSVLFFVAPRSGTFNLVAASYDYQDRGGYTLAMAECPVLGTLDTTGTYQLTLPVGAARCTRPGHPANLADPYSYAFLRVPVDMLEALTVEVDAAAFYPVGEVFGVGFDTYGNLYDGSDYGWFAAVATPVTITTGEVSGIATVAVGTLPVSSGSFTVSIARTSLVAPATLAARTPAAPTLRTERRNKQPR